MQFTALSALSTEATVTGKDTYMVFTLGSWLPTLVAHLVAQNCFTSSRTLTSSGTTLREIGDWLLLLPS